MKTVPNRRAKALAALMLSLVFLAGAPPPITLPATAVTLEAGNRRENMRTTFYDGECVSLTISDGKLSAGMAFPSIPKYDWALLRVVDDTGAIMSSKTALSREGLSTDVSKLPDGSYCVKLYTNAAKTGSFAGYLVNRSVVMSVKDGRSYFEDSPALPNNIEILTGKRSDEFARAFYLLPSGGIESEDPAIMKAAAQITQGIHDDYAKIHAIHDYVASNIWYDYDALTAGERPTASAVYTLNEGRGICYGYAMLYAALCRASGIPCKTVCGYALGAAQYTDGVTWADEASHDVCNHIWNEAYVNSRWVTVDTAWDSNNEWRDGEKAKSAPACGKYFDTTPEFFASTHRIANYDESFIYDKIPQTPDDETTKLLAGLMKEYVVPKPLLSNMQTDARFDEALVMLWNVFARRNPTIGGYTYKSVQDNLNASPYSNSIMGAVYMGMVKPDFNPAATITNEELAALLYNADSVLKGGAPLPQPRPNAKDDATASKWAAPYITYCLDNNLLALDNEGRFKPKQRVTRLAAMTAAGKLLQNNP